MDWTQNPRLFRDKVRKGQWGDSTVSVCSDYVQANLVILPRKFALDFTMFCLRNPQPCPILEILEAGDPMVHEMATGADIRVHLPRYRIFENGELVQEVDNIHNYDQKRALIAGESAFAWGSGLKVFGGDDVSRCGFTENSISTC